MAELNTEAIIANQPYPLLFATVSGAHLYGFPSPDSDYDLRGVHILPLSEVAGLHRLLESARDESHLPDTPTCKPALNELLLQIRGIV